jgi:predicted DNA-binding protein YlxM (UPF0122 family)
MSSYSSFQTSATSSKNVVNVKDTQPKGEDVGNYEVLNDDEDNDNQITNPIIPLPASHLPDELATLQIYGMQLEAGIHKLLIKDITISSLNPMESSSFPMFSDDELGGDVQVPVFGYVVEKKNGDDWVGAIGCAADVIFVIDNGVKGENYDSRMENEGNEDSELNDISLKNENDPLIVLCKGSFRFVVKEVIQTFPYPIALVDELLDDEPSFEIASDPLVTTIKKEYNDFQDSFEEEDEDDDEDDDDDGITVETSDLIPRTMAAMKTLVDQKLNSIPPSLTPLEEAILKESGRDPNMNTAYLEKNRAEEMAAILDIFRSSLLDIAPSKMERLYVVAIMAAEIAGLDNDVRKKILTTVDGVARLRVVLAEAEKKISLVQAKKITKEIMQKNDQESKELKVGIPSLPPWAKSIKKGVKIEYFWNEIEGWCKGEVIEDPVMILDELIVTVRFEDGDIQKLPFRGDEKARWRPGGMGR